MLTFTAPWSAADVTWPPPSAPYLRTPAGGRQEAHDWDVPPVAE